MNEHIHSSTITGWREWVSLPNVGVTWLKAKIDTGARSSALHAFDVEEFERDGASWVRFGIHPWQQSQLDAVTVELPIHDRRTIRSSNGQSEQRLVVLLDIELSGRTVSAEVTLTNRDVMDFRMLIGREALAQGFVVNPAASYLGGKPKKATRRRNRGKSTPAA